MAGVSNSKASTALVIWSKLAGIIIAFAIQIGIFVVTFLLFASYFPWVVGLQLVISLCVLVMILGSDMPPEYKLSWTIAILVLPIFGGVFYLFYGRHMLNKKDRARLDAAAAAASATFPAKSLISVNNPQGLAAPKPNQVPQQAMALPEPARRQVTFLGEVGSFPAYDQTAVSYYPLGDDALPAMLAEMERAEHFILFQYFILSAGEMWDRIHEVMVRKAAQGVKVLVMYDDLGSYFTLPANLHQTLNSEGILVQALNKFGGKVQLKYNNRDHRKILVVDGRVGFTGGINIADEYINKVVVHGHWKDTVIKLEGPAVRSLQVMFLTWWNGQVDPIDLNDFRPRRDFSVPDAVGYVQPYDDSPFDDQSVGEDAYLNLIEQARTSVDIFSPYLIIDSRMQEGLAKTARSGVRVRIVTPHVADKWYVHETTRSYYEKLTEAGVEIYEYTPGFIHAKQMVADNQHAIVGTINLDYRSLYLHNECAVYMYNTPVIEEISADIEATIAISQRISYQQAADVSWFRRSVRALLRTFGNMM